MVVDGSSGCRLVVDGSYYGSSVQKMKSEIDTGPYVLILNPPGMRRRSDVSIRSQIGQDVADHAETLSRRRNSYVNEINLFETSLRRLIGT